MRDELTKLKFVIKKKRNHIQVTVLGEMYLRKYRKIQQTIQENATYTPKRIELTLLFWVGFCT